MMHGQKKSNQFLYSSFSNVPL